MKTDFYTMTKNFVMKEAAKPGLKSYIQGLNEIISSLSPRSIRERRRLELAKEHIREIRRHTTRLEEQVRVLNERVSVLEESKDETLES